MLGCIADDVTGATDLAINLARGGMCVVQVLHVPSLEELSRIDADAVVVALKTRSIAKSAAVEQSLRTLRVLRTFGIRRFFFKYCSTFDSTREGNIGPVATALLDDLGAKQTILCPAFPRHGRTVYQGHLFVYDQLLNECGMENHPLNPMTDANLIRFLGQQCNRKIGLLAAQDIEPPSDPEPRSGDSVKAKLDALATNGCSLVITDACHDQHLETIARAVTDLPLITGGSGIGPFLVEAYRDDGLLTSPRCAPVIPRIAGRSLIVAGSCSIATNRQVAWMKNRVPSWTLDVDALLNDREATFRHVIDWANSADSASPLLIASTAPPTDVATIQGKHGADVAAQAVEEFLAEVTSSLVKELPIARLIVAGGETSGAVVNQLGVRALRIGAEICPGVPWTESVGPQPLALALKSGNFGEERFFEQALEMLP